MDANDFIGKLRANGSENDWCDISQVHIEYDIIFTKLTNKNKDDFAVNVLCTICRNLDKVPSWCEKIDVAAVLMLSIHCCTQIHTLRAQEQRALACIYHIHKFFAVKKNGHVPPELVIKLSHMAFDSEKLLKEYCKTYWNIIVDRLTYIEKLKARRLAVCKLLPNLLENVLQVISIYDTAAFCSNIITFLIKKLHAIFSDKYYNEVNRAFGKIFECLTKKSDIKLLKKFSDNELTALYKKFNDCFYVIAENASKMNFVNSSLGIAVRKSIALVGHKPDIFHCLQTFYLNSFCSIFTNSFDSSFVETILSSLVISLENTLVLYETTFRLTCPFLNQLLRLYIEFSIKNHKNNFTVEIQIICLKLIIFLIKHMKYTEQLLKCDNCNTKSGLHDSLRLSFVSKLFVVGFNSETDLPKILPLYIELVKLQHVTVSELRELGCSNIDKYYRKVQTDIHNIAVSLNKSNTSDFAIQLFNMYLKEEFSQINNSDDFKNISRALYNKSICEMDSSSYKDALNDAYLSLVFSHPEGLKVDKYMSLVIDIKAKVLKTEADHQEHLQMMSVLDVCDAVVVHSEYKEINQFFSNVKFSSLLKHEYRAYARLWPSLQPVAGAWAGLHRLLADAPHWTLREEADALLWTLLEVMADSAGVVRSLFSEPCARVVRSVLARVTHVQRASAALLLARATLLLLAAELDLRDAARDHNWKCKDVVDPDTFVATRTLAQEHAAVSPALAAVDLLTDLIKQVNKVPVSECMVKCVRVVELVVPLLESVGRDAHAMQAAHALCALADRLGDHEVYVRNASAVLSLARCRSRGADALVAGCALRWEQLHRQESTVDTALNYICELALYYWRSGDGGAAARLVAAAQWHVTRAGRDHPALSLQLATGRLLEAQRRVAGGGRRARCALSDHADLQRHYLALTNRESCCTSRRRTSLRWRSALWRNGVSGCVWRLGLARRARAAAAAVLPLAPAAPLAALLLQLTRATCADTAQEKIDNLMYVLGLEVTNKSTPQQEDVETSIKRQLFTPKQECPETMLECHSARSQGEMAGRGAGARDAEPTFVVPATFRHDAPCQCAACQLPASHVLALQVLALQANTYFRTKQSQASRQYFEGTLQCFQLVRKKLNDAMKHLAKKNFQKYVIETAERDLDSSLRHAQIQFLIDASYFELSQDDHGRADEYAVMIHEIITDMTDLDPYLNQEVLNLMMASARLRRQVRRRDVESMSTSP